MLTSIRESLDGREGNYLLPFFWQHGESEPVLRDYVKAIRESGCRAFCVEARPHPDYCGPGWWRDMDIILEEARDREMKVWILDDAHFPTGYANGALLEADPSLCKQYLFFSRSDICGPMPQATLNVDAVARFRQDMPPPMSFFMGSAKQRVFDDDSLLAVVAGRVGRKNQMDSLLDLTPLVRDGVLYWDVPQGYWKVFVLYLTRNGGGRPDYINVLDRQSCRLQIDAVYEPHFERYGSEFGKTIAGFFSDEPLFGNTVGFQFDESIGRKVMPLPWSAALPDLLEEKLGRDWLLSLPLLWEEGTDSHLSARARVAYMDIATQLVEANFSYQIGDWCRAHGVEYIGHVIEDNDQHARLGCTLGHYFRSLDGQDMAGIDDIGGQVIPGAEDVVRPALFGSPGDGEFYHFVLGKLASSHAHIDPKKKGRAMCEIFGAYGWSLGVRQMKYLADHFLVRGVNRYVPHAFSPKDYPDPDCPPHFYAHGRNPLFRHFATLMHYMNRVCHLLEDSVHVAPVALLYHGESEWAGDYMSDKKPARVLHENQIDFDIIPADVFTEREQYGTRFDGALKINRESYRALVIPYSQFLTEGVAAFVAETAGSGFPIILIDALPEGISDCNDKGGEADLLRAIAACTVTSLGALPTLLRQTICCDFLAQPVFRRLRYYHCLSDGQELYLILNEDPGEPYEGIVSIPAQGEVSSYNAYDNTLAPASTKKTEGGMEIALSLQPLEMAIFVIDPTKEAPEAFTKHARCQYRPVSAEWTVSIAESLEYPDFHDSFTTKKLDSIAKRYPNFSGFVRYETEITLSPEDATADYLELEDAYEGAELWINDANAGIQIAKPYRFAVGSLLKPGMNTLRIEVANTLARENHESIESAAFGNRESKILAPTGIVGEVSLVHRID